MNSKHMQSMARIIAVFILIALMAGLTPGAIRPAYAAPSDKAITAFNFSSPAAVGTINEATHTITLSVPFGTNVTSLVPTVTHNGASVSPSSGVAQDFTNPVTYTVYAADTSQQNYTVTVVILITVTANPGQNKPFGGADPVFTYTASNPVFFTGALDRVSGESVGTYAIGRGTLSAVGNNYVVNFISNNFTITAKPITVTANPGQSKVFGTADPTLTYTSSDPAVTFTGALSRTAGEAVGNYPINQGTLSAGGNYNINFVSNNFAITARPITVTANPGQSKVFGAADPVFTYISSDPTATFTGALSRTAGESVGTYAINQGTLSAGSNYSINFVSNSFAITAKPITVTPTAGQSKVFGAADPTLTYTSSDPAATFTGALSRAAGESVGAYAINQGTLSAGGNYTLTVAPENFAITPKPVIISPTSGQNKVFGTADPTFTYTSSDPAATLTGSLSRVAGESVGTYNFTLGTLSAGSNYSLGIAAETFAITAKPITVTANSGQSKVFGAADPVFTYTSSDPAATFTGALSRAAGESVGTYAIALGTLSAGSNYNINFVSSNFSITAKPITVTPTAGQSKAFGAADPTLVYTSSDPAATFTGVLSRAAGESVGTYAINQGTLSAGSNYTLTVAPENFAITPKPVTITPTAGQSKVFGAVDPTLTYTSSDPAATLTGALSRAAGESVGTYAINLGTLSVGSNYTLTVAPENFAITPKPVTITPTAGQSKIFGAPDPTFTYTSSDPAATFTGSLSRAAGESIGTYNLTLGTLSAGGNYSLSIAAGTFAIIASPEKDITAFGFTTPAAIGVITGTNIAVTVPFGTDVTALVATFTTTGASVRVGATTQVSGTTPNDFTSPVNYVVTAADSSTKTYTVTVTVAANPAKDITAFSFTTPAATGVITGANIAVTVPFGTDVTALVATFTTTGASVRVGATTQVSGTTPNNFTNPVNYVVIAADSSTKTYTVTVTIAPSPEKDITAFSFTTPAATGVITGTNIAVTVPFGTDVTALVATFTTTGASVRVGATIQVSGTTSNNFTSPVNYVVTAADASTKDYTVTVTVAANPAKDITAFSFTTPAATGVITGTNIAVTVPFGTDVTALVATFTTTGASVRVGATTQVSGTTPNDFTSPVNYVVTAADSSTKTYTVTVTVAANPAKDITAFSFTSPAATGIITGTNIAVTVPFGTDVTALVATFTTTGASVRVGATTQVSGTTPNNFTGTVTYTVVAADSSTKTYTVTVTFTANSAKDITAFSFTTPAATGVITGTNIAVTVPFGTDVTALVATFTTTGVSVRVGATTQISGTTPNNFTSPVTYTVTAADASTKDYTVTITVAANPAKDITAFSFTTPAATGVITGTNIAVMVPFGTDVTALVANFTTTGASVRVGATVQVSGTTSNNFTSPVNYVVTAVDSSTKTYTVTVTIAPSPAKDITAFSFTTPAATGVITGTNIAVTVPFGTDVTALVATFATTGASVRVGATTQVSGTTPNNFTVPVNYVVTAADSSTKTYTVTVTVGANSAKDITAFSFTTPAATGMISGTNIAVTVPFGTDVTALVATFTTTGASVRVGATVQVSGTTSNNFTSPVTYTVVAADSSTKDYTVTVTVGASPAKDITAFNFTTPAATGVITGTNIAVTVPFGTDVTTLVATFTTTGASVRVGATPQVSGTTPNNFTSPVSYIVTAADASTKTYTVTVTVATISAKDITTFSFTSPAATGVITGTNIAVTVPFGTDVTALVATFTTTGASVRVGATIQVSGTTPNNFTNPVIYTVTAADSSTKTYTVTVTVAGNSAKDITTFSITSPAATGVITGTNIGVTVPFGTDVTALVSTFITTGASVRVGATTQVSGTTPNNFTSPVTYTVTAADASTKTYTVTVTVATNSAKDITGFSFTSPAATGVITGTNIAVTVPFGTDVTALVATFTTTGASVRVGATTQVSGTTPNNFTSPVSYVVTAADSSTKTYTVTVTVAANPAKDITTFSFTTPAATGVITGTNIAVTVPFGTNVTALVATFTTTGASVRVGATPQVSGTTPNNFTSPVTYIVTAADTSTKTYTVTVTVAANPAKNITSFSFASPAVTGVISGANIAVTVPYGTNVSALVASFTTTGTSVNVGGTPQVSGTTPNNFTNPVTYTVTAADSSTKNYTVTVTVAANPAKRITAFSFSTPAATGVITGSNIAVTVPYGTDVTALVATFTTTGASVKVGATVQVSGTTPNDFTNPVTYTVTAADASTKKYIVTVTTAANPAKDITSFRFTAQTAAGVISGTDIAVTVPYETNVTALTATFTTTGTSVRVGATTQVSGTTINNFTNPITYTVTAEDGTTKDYRVTVTVAADPAKDITAFSFTNPAAAGVITGTNIAVMVPYGTNVSMLAATFTTTGTSVRVGTTTQVSGTTPNNFTKPVSYVVIAADGSTKTYTVTVTVAANLGIKEITSFGFTNPAATGVITGTDIAVKVPYGTNLRALVAAYRATGASVKVGNTTQVSGTTPNDFTNPVTYTVTAADGSTIDYVVTVTAAGKSAKDIITFNFTDPAAVGTISGTNITVKVPYGANLSALTAHFTTTGASVRVGSTIQVSGVTVNNFTKPVTYTVIAADKSTRAYTVTVTIVANDITSFGFKDPTVTGVIDGTNITVVVPFRTRVNQLVAVFTTTGSSVRVGTTAQVSGKTVNNFTSPVTYIVTAADKSTKAYKVTVIVSRNVISEKFRSTGYGDGWVLESGEYSNVGGSSGPYGNLIRLGDDADDRQYRALLHFPTYYLPDNAVITKATLMIQKKDVVGTDPFTTHGPILVDINKGLFLSYNAFSRDPLPIEIFQAPADMYSAGIIQDNPEAGWHWASLDSKAFPYINLTGGTQIRLGFQLDDNDDLDDDYINFFSGDKVAQNDRPYLRVEYYVP